MTAARSSARSPAARAAWISAPHRLIFGKSLGITGTLLGSDPQTFSLATDRRLDRGRNRYVFPSIVSPPADGC
jgi:hypothetical protein